ncbi:hypothetical protein ASC90_21735 [Rhizobium sp. Root1220]|nr:hypothetical protein ASC90_21735 [Rhizobium sp. Root1220]
MQFPERSKKLEWNFNTGVTIFGVICGLVVTSIGWGVTYANMRNDNKDLQEQILDIKGRLTQDAEDRKDRLRGYQATLDGMQSRIGEITPLTLNLQRAVEQGSENKMAVVETNKRIDRVVESVGGKLDTLIDTINKVATRVEVLGSKIDANGKSDKSAYRTPIYKP